ncbi:MULTISPECIES: hypothetical protein [Haloferacaceae]|uniref:Uncharacterized protein n=1 Tax=Halorubrum glutamatedens TaxID=2707018 RepID=A0ABD5QRP2_9EURY|nr:MULTISPECIES: hypothetical protein [Haloferacales]
MSDRTDRLLAVLVILMGLLVIAQTTVVPRNQSLGTIGLIVGAASIGYAASQIVAAR